MALLPVAGIIWTETSSITPQDNPGFHPPASCLLTTSLFYVSTTSQF